jgi:hypothetical protein
MLRWDVRFSTHNADVYLRQLDRLGCILAFPATDKRRAKYLVVRDLKARPAPVLDEGLSQLMRIYYIDDNPDSVRGVMQALGLGLRPSRIAMFLSPEVERQLLELEKKAYEARYGPYDEERIYETRFRVNPLAGDRIEVISVVLKGPVR